MTEQADKYRQAAQQMERLAELDEEEAEVKESVERELDTELKGMFTHVMSEHDIPCVTITYLALRVYKMPRRATK